ncbi:hypothetical protein Efla_001465 [Eimeria flavescens]
MFTASDCAAGSFCLLQRRLGCPFQAMGDYGNVDGGPQGASSSGPTTGGLLPLGGPSGSNVSHRLADIGRSFLARFSSVPQTSQFVDKGTLTPQEFVDAGDLLVFKFPTWQWEAAVGKRVNSWLPPDKQFLVTRGVACHKRVRDIEASLNANAKEDAEGWFLPVDDDQEGPQEAQALSSSSSTSAAKGKADPFAGSSSSALLASFRWLGEDSSQMPAAVAVNISQDDPACADASNSYFVRQAPDAACGLTTSASPKRGVWSCCVHQREAKNGTPLTPLEIFEDILTDYAAKTVTVDPHPCTGVPTASIHPCKHAQVMKKVVDHWRFQGIEPRPDLALIVLLKFISSVIPTIDYDFTMDIDMGLCGPAPSKPTSS